MANAVYNSARRLIARDGYIVPLRIGSYLLDTFYAGTSCLLNNLQSGIASPLDFKKNGSGIFVPDDTDFNVFGVCMGIDTISWRKSYTGGTVEPGETLLEAGLSEDREEAGEERDPVVVDPTIISFLSRNTFADETEEEPVVGLEYKLRAVFRTMSTVLPIEQPAKQDELYSELLKPGYSFMSQVDAPFRMLRPSFLEAFQQAIDLDILYSIRKRNEVIPDYETLARKWEKLRIHPDIIEYYCFDWKNSERWKSDVALYGETIAGLMQNLDYSEKGLHKLLMRPLPHHKQIRKLQNMK